MVEVDSSFDTHSREVSVSYGPAPLELAGFQNLSKGHFSMVDGCWHRIQTHFCSWRTESLTATPHGYHNDAGGVKFELSAYTVFKSLTVGKTSKTVQIKTVQIHALLQIQETDFSMSLMVSFLTSLPKKTVTSLPGRGVLSVQLPWWWDLKQHAMGKQGAFGNPKISCPVYIPTENARRTSCRKLFETTAERVRVQATCPHHGNPAYFGEVEIWGFRPAAITSRLSIA